MATTKGKPGRRPAPKGGRRPFGTLSTKALEAKLTDAEVASSELQDDFATGAGMADPAEARRRTGELEKLTAQLAQREDKYFGRADA